MKTFLVITVTSLILLGTVATRAFLNCGLVAILCYIVLPCAKIYLEPNFIECMTYGIALLLIGSCLKVGIVDLKEANK